MNKRLFAAFMIQKPQPMFPHGQRKGWVAPQPLEKSTQIIIAVLLNTASAANGQKEPAFLSSSNRHLLTLVLCNYILEPLKRNATLVSPN